MSTDEHNLKILCWQANPILAVKLKIYVCENLIQSITPKILPFQQNLKHDVTPWSAIKIKTLVSRSYVDSKYLSRMRHSERIKKEIKASERDKQEEAEQILLVSLTPGAMTEIHAGFSTWPRTTRCLCGKSETTAGEQWRKGIFDIASSCRCCWCCFMLFVSRFQFNIMIIGVWLDCENC